MWKCLSVGFLNRVLLLINFIYHTAVFFIPLSRYLLFSSSTLFQKIPIKSTLTSYSWPYLHIYQLTEGQGHNVISHLPSNWPIQILAKHVIGWLFVSWVLFGWIVFLFLLGCSWSGHNWSNRFEWKGVYWKSQNQILIDFQAFKLNQSKLYVIYKVIWHSICDIVSICYIPWLNLFEKAKHESDWTCSQRFSFVTGHFELNS